MKCALAILASLTPFHLQAQLLVSESFNYPDGGLPSASSGRWHHHSGSTGTLRVQDHAARVFQADITETSLEDVHVHFSPEEPVFRPDTDGINGNNCLFVSYWATFQTLPTGKSGGQNIGSYFAHFLGDSSHYGMVGASLQGAAAGKLRIGIASLEWSQYATYYPQDLVLGVAYRIVSRYDLDTQQTTLWIDPSEEASPSVTFTPDLKKDQTAISSLALRQGTTAVKTTVGGPGDLLLDQLSIGREWADVVSPVPEPATSGVVVGAGLAIAAALRRRLAQPKVP